MKKSLFLFTISLFSSFIFAQKKFKTNSVSIFKDGTVFFDKTTNVDASNGSFSFSELPFSKGAKYVLFGSIWFKAPNNSIPFIKVSNKKIELETEIKNLNVLFIKNIGKQIKVISLSKGQIIEGILKMTADNNLIIQNGNQWNKIPLSDLSSFEFLGEMITSFETSSTEKVLELEFSKKIKNQSLQLMYLQKGISWSPNYYLELLGDQKAKLSLKANVLNDLEDVTDVEMNFVVGVPSFNFGHIHDPLASSQDFHAFLASLNRNNRTSQNNYFSNADRDYTLAFDPETYEEAIVLIGEKPQVEGANNEDLFFYKKRNVTLEQGSRAMFDILEMEFEYEDIYTCYLNSSHFKSNKYSNGQNENQRNLVWHTLVFENETEYPLTSGSIFFMKKTSESTNLPISQNQLSYTPSKGEADVKMTVAPDIIILDADKEIKREMNVRNNHDDLVTVEGSINITNHRTNEVNLEVNRIITGDLLESDLSWKTVGITTQLNDLNKKFKVSWEFKLKAGETKKITYTYQVYFR
ncbi:MAG: hypothetical protein AB8F94_18970 [Saprospiraceae bacterium]